MPLKRTAGYKACKRALREGVCVHVCKLLFFYPAGNQPGWNYGKADAQGRSQNLTE